MARLPQPGADNGEWGDILNEFLGVVHDSSGVLKSNSVTATVIAPGAITAAGIATNAVTSAALADQSVGETKLSSDVQALLHAPATIADDSIVTSKIAEEAVTKDKLSLAVQESLTNADVASQTFVTDASMRTTAPTTAIRASLYSFHATPALSLGTPQLTGRIPRLNQNAVTGITGAVRNMVKADNTGAALWDGPISVVTQTVSGVDGCVVPANPDGTAGTSSGIRWRFITDAPNWCLDLSGNASSSFYILRDGEILTDGAIAVPGARYYRVLEYEYTGFHEYEIVAGPGFYLSAIITAPNDTIYAPEDTRPLVGFICDSYGSFSTSIGTAAVGLIGQICRSMGWRARITTQGGTGYQTVDSTTPGSKTFADRIARFDDIAVDAMVFLGGRNDPTAGLEAAATSVVQRFQSTHPGIPTIISGPWSPSTSWETSGSQAGNFAVLQQVAVNTGSIYVDTKNIIIGEGDIVSNPGVAGNSSRMISGAHPTRADISLTTNYADGQGYHGAIWARRLASKIGARV